MDGATSCGIDCVSALDSPALDSHALDPPALDSPALDPPTLDPPALDPPALEPPALDPTALDPTALGPTALDPTALDPTALDPTALDPTTTVACVASPPLPPAGCQSPFFHVRLAACCLSVGLVCRPPTAHGIRSQLGPIHPLPRSAVFYLPRLDLALKSTQS